MQEAKEWVSTHVNFQGVIGNPSEDEREQCWAAVNSRIEAQKKREKRKELKSSKGLVAYYYCWSCQGVKPRKPPARIKQGELRQILWSLGYVRDQGGDRGIILTRHCRFPGPALLRSALRVHRRLALARVRSRYRVQDPVEEHTRLPCGLFLYDARPDDVEEEDLIPFNHDGHPYAIYRSPEDEYYCTAACVHGARK